MSDSNNSLAFDGRYLGSLLILRLTLGGFLFLWAIEKFIIPGTVVSIYRNFFFGIVDGTTITYAIGAVLTIMSLAYIIGAYKRWVYLYGFIIHAISVASSWNRIIDPYGLIEPSGFLEKGDLFRGKPEHLFLASVPVLAGFWLLYVMRDRDTKWCTRFGNDAG
ncbi:MAG TPA: hypothetical protein ENI72_04120 [Rhodospirillales bacterium]|nr:hypothetical protein [Rhodospirillales bacterium]